MTLSVLHVDTERGWRGGERQALWLGREMFRHGIVTVMAGRTGEPLLQRSAEAGLETVACEPITELDLRAAWRLRGELIRRDIAIVHAHTGHAVAVAALASAGTRARMVVSRRVDFPLRRNAATRLKYGRAAAIIAISEAVARVLEASGVPHDLICVVPDGVDLDRRVEAASQETLAALGVPAGSPLVVQVAQLVGHKDPLTFVRAVASARARVPAIQALLVGDGALRGDVEREAARLDLSGTLHILGYRTDADALLAAAGVACLSSREEGMGSVLLDALAFGLPVAATRAGGIPEVIVHGEHGLLAPVGDSAALGDAIAELLLNAALADGMRHRARARADQFSVARMADRTIAVYDRVLRGADRPR